MVNGNGNGRSNGNGNGQQGWRLGNQTFASEAEYLAERNRRLDDLARRLRGDGPQESDRANDGNENGNGNGNGHGNGNTNGQHDWTVAGKTYSTFREYLEARDRRKREFLMLGARVGPEALGPPLVVPDWATPENFDPDPVWPVAEVVNEALDNRFRLFTAAQLNSEQHATRYLIPGILAAGQPGGIFGAFKTLKTSLAADLLISLASGTPFLGRFPVSEPGRVVFLSGESGLAALRSTARRICAERGLSLEELDNFVISPDIPRLDRPVDLMALRELIEKEKPVCLVIDPAYLAIGETNCRNLFAMGAMLMPLAELCKSTGCTVLLVHHCKRSTKAGIPATLDDIAWSGFAEFSAQWLMVSRRRPFEPDTGRHELWLSAGSRLGNHGLWALDVDEGATAPLPDDGPIELTGEDQRSWKTSLRSVAWAEAQADQRFVETSEDRRLRRRAIAFEHQCQRVLELLTGSYPDGRTARFLRDTLGMSGDRINRLLDVLIEKGHVLRIEDRIVDKHRPIVTYCRVQVIDFCRGTAPAPGAVGVAHGGTLRPAAGWSCDEAAAGRDTMFDGKNMRDLTSPQARCDAAPSALSSPASAAPGPGAVPLAGRDTSIDGKNMRDLSCAQPGRDAGSRPLHWQAVRGQGG